MTNEDREGQSLVQADFVARRENLDLLLFEQSKNVYGKEFSIFLQLENEPQNRELCSEYSLLKSLSFVEDIIQQLEQIKEEQDIEKHQKKTFSVKALMIRQKLPSVQYGSSSSAQLGGLFEDLIELAQIFGFTLTPEMLRSKSEQCSV